MAKTFTMIACGDYKELHSGHLMQEDILEIENLLHEISSHSETDNLDLEIFYMVYLDFFDSPIEPATQEEIIILDEILEILMEGNYIEILDSINFNVMGTKEKFIDTIME